MFICFASPLSLPFSPRPLSPRSPPALPATHTSLPQTPGEGEGEGRGAIDIKAKVTRWNIHNSHVRWRVFLPFCNLAFSSVLALRKSLLLLSLYPFEWVDTFIKLVSGVTPRHTGLHTPYHACHVKLGATVLHTFASAQVVHTLHHTRHTYGTTCCNATWPLG